MQVSRCAPLLAALAIALAGQAVAQPRFAAPPNSGQPAQPPAQDARPFASSPYPTLQAERCANFERELQAALNAEREARTTTSSDQASLRRQQIEDQMQKAGC
jgi:hypothetical protein